MKLADDQAELIRLYIATASSSSSSAVSLRSSEAGLGQPRTSI